MNRKLLLAALVVLALIFPVGIGAYGDLEIDFGGHHGNPLFMLTLMRMAP